MPITLIEQVLQDAFWSAFAALGFAILFNVPRQVLPACMLTGAVGHAVRTLMLELGTQIAPATLVGAIVIGFTGSYFAHRYRLPALVFTVSGAITLVPGVFAFRTMVYLLRVTTAENEAAIQSALLNASQNGITTGVILAALAVGISAPTLLFERHRPVV